MKFWISLLLLSYSCYLTAQSQSSTYEFSPSFQKSNLAYISEVVDFNPSFSTLSFVGISCYHFDSEYKDIRYRILQEGQWSTWQVFSPQHEMDTKIRTAYQGPFITSNFSALQFKTNVPLKSKLTIRLFLGKLSKSGENKPLKSISCEPEDRCDRSCWCPSCPIDSTPELTTATHIIVHHSGGSNQPSIGYSEVVKFIWDFHVNTNGWDDIGYNWLIDPNGVLYEGRPDGYQGAHFSCINENTVGICLLGDFTMIPPTNEAVNTLINLLGFEATDHNINVLNTSYHETGDYDLANVAGHLDGNDSPNSCSSTSCPGDMFYPMLDSIRIKVSELACYQDNITSADEVDKPSLLVYPNPFQTSINIRQEGPSPAIVELIDIKGQTCGTLLVNETHDLSHLCKGIYFVLNDGQLIEKIIKQ